MNEQILGFLSNHIELLRSKRVIVYGTGLNAKNLIPMLIMFQISVEGIIDDDERQWGTKLFGFDIKPPSEIFRQEPEHLLYLLTMTNGLCVMEKLSAIGMRSGVNFISILRNSDMLGLDIAQERIINGVKVGKYSRPPYNKGFLNAAVVESIGAFCSINPTALVAENHNKSYITTHSIMYRLKSMADGAISDNHVVMTPLIEEYHRLNRNKGKVVIGNDVWIGAGVVIMPGITVGDGAILGANSVITKDVPDYAIAVGLPARVIDFRFSPEEIAVLQELQWWTWSDKDIETSLSLFADKEQFFNRYRR